MVEPLELRSQRRLRFFIKEFNLIEILKNHFCAPYVKASAVRGYCISETWQLNLLELNAGRTMQRLK